MTLFDLLDLHAKVRPYDVAVIHPRGSLTYLALRSTIASVALKLRSRGIQPDTTVAIYVTDPFLHLTLILGLMLNGVRSVSAHPNYDAMPATLPIDTYLCDKTLPLAGSTAVVHVDNSWVEQFEQEMAFPRERGFQNEDAICRVFTSSGTTGIPKAIGHTSRGINCMTMETLARNPLFMSGPVMSMMAISSIGGFVTAYQALWAGIPLVQATNLMQVLRAVNLYKVSTLLASPVQIQALIGMLKGRGARFPSLLRLSTGGASLPKAVGNAARALICPNLVNIYGATETYGGIVQAPVGLLDGKPNAAGYVLPGVQVKVLDVDGAPVPPGSEGVIHIKTPFMSDGYIGDPIATAECFRDGWFVPGDLGAITDDGLLLITGRTSEMINAGGVKVSPQLVDDFLLMQPGVRDAATFAAHQPGGVEQVWAAIVVDTGFDEEALRQACVHKLNSRAPVRFFQVPQLPRNTMGKVLRRELADSLVKLQVH